jgi:hypothetical protein
MKKEREVIHIPKYPCMATKYSDSNGVIFGIPRYFHLT